MPARSNGRAVEPRGAAWCRALVAALERRELAGAGLDVFDREPLPASHPLLGLDNTVLTPHLGYVTRETYAIFYRQALEDIFGYLRGTPLRELSA